VHLEICVEDQSSKILIEYVCKSLFAENNAPPSWRIHPYKGAGRLPKNLKPKSDANKRILLDQLPRLLRGFGKTPGVDFVVVVVDADDRDCKNFLEELHGVATECGMSDRTLFRLAIEETEAWYLGNRTAFEEVFPNVKKEVLDSYLQDSAIGTWELIANAVEPGGCNEIKQKGWQAIGAMKADWAERIGPKLKYETNSSPSFRKLCEGLRRISSVPDEQVGNPAI
jgi:hypothetical protein